MTSSKAPKSHTTKPARTSPPHRDSLPPSGKPRAKKATAPEARQPRALRAHEAATTMATPGKDVERHDGTPRLPAREVMSAGTVTFLDVLGWKGIWLRRDSLEVVGQLRKLVESAKRLSRGADKTQVLSISDTIVLLTVGDEAKGVDLHGRVTAELVCESIDCGLPLRGATSVGEFFVDEPSILVGSAVDEAASWHEAVDWIGVVQTTAAFLVHDGTPGAWKMATAPVKVGGPWNLPCADWPSEWRRTGRTKKDLHECFSEMGPFDPTIAAKYKHTLAFYGDDPAV